MKAKVYEYEKCSTCRKALKFLQSREVSFERLPILEQPPTRAELERMLEALGGDVRRLFNTSGRAYRELGISQRLASMSRGEALALLASNGQLVKRPFVLTERGGAVGFAPERWARLF